LAARSPAEHLEISNLDSQISNIWRRGTLPSSGDFKFRISNLKIFGGEEPCRSCGDFKFRISNLKIFGGEKPCLHPEISNFKYLATRALPGIRGFQISNFKYLAARALPGIWRFQIFEGE